MATVIIHATVTLDGYLAGPHGEVDWMFDVAVAPEDETHVAELVGRIGAVVGGADPEQTVEDGEEPYGGLPGVPVFLMTHTPHAPIEKGGVTYTFVVDDIARAVELASEAAGDRVVSVDLERVHTSASADEAHLVYRVKR